MSARLTLALIACLCAPAALHAQSELTLDETARWLQADGTEMAYSSSDELATSNLRRVTYKASATLALHDCHLTIVLTDDSGVSGFTNTIDIPLREVDSSGVQAVSRAEGYHDFLSIPGRYLVTISARTPASYPFVTTSSRGKLRSYLAAIPVKDPEAATRIVAVLRHATLLCGAPESP